METLVGLVFVVVLLYFFGLWIFPIAAVGFLLLYYLYPTTMPSTKGFEGSRIFYWVIIFCTLRYFFDVWAIPIQLALFAAFHICIGKRTRYIKLRKAQADTNIRETMVVQKPPVDINAASREELLTLPGIGAAEAGLILKRTQSGQGFGNLDELGEYLRLKPHKMSQLRGKVRFSPRTAAVEVHPDGDTGDSPKPRFGRTID